jgi:hypothetical protein
MDEARIDHRRTAAGCVAVIALLGAAFALGRCSAPAEAQQTPPLTLDAATAAGYDFHAAASQALADLDAYLVSIATTTTSPRSAAAPQADPAAPATPSGDRWDQLAMCETGGNWSANTGNGFGGGLQFMHQRSYSTWLSFGGGEFAPHPWEASREQQIDIAERVLASSGWRAWPGCSRKFGWL